MPAALKRLLRVRMLEEELRRAELEAEAARLAGLEQAAEHAAGRSARSRGESFAAIVEAGGEGWGPADDRRLAAEAAWAEAVRGRQRIEALLPGQRLRVERAREQFLAERRDRRRLGILLDAAGAAALEEERRREQRWLDEWFRSREVGKEGGKE